MLKIDDATSALEYAQHFADLPLRETWGKNRSAEIDELCRLIGMPNPDDRVVDGPPYCAIGVCACFLLFFQQHAGEGREFQRTAGSQAIKRFMALKGWLSTNPNDILGWEGALFGWTNVGDEEHGHVGFVAGRLTDKAGKVTGIRTVEFNSDLSGDRNGDGCYALVRRMSPNGYWRVENAKRQPVGKARRLWFANTTAFKGGKWW